MQFTSISHIFPLVNTFLKKYFKKIIFLTIPSKKKKKEKIAPQKKKLQ